MTEKRKFTGLQDKHGNEIREGDWISLDGNITADDTFGLLPNGYVFNEEHVYQVFWDKDAVYGKGCWGLRTEEKPDSDENKKYLNHVYTLLHRGRGEIVDPPDHG